MRDCSFKNLPTAATQNSHGLAKTDPKPHVTFHSECMSVSHHEYKPTVVALKVFPVFHTWRPRCRTIIYIQAPAGTSGWTLTTLAVDVILTQCCSVSKMTTCLWHTLGKSLKISAINCLTFPFAKFTNWHHKLRNTEITQTVSQFPIFTCVTLMWAAMIDVNQCMHATLTRQRKWRSYLNI